MLVPMPRAIEKIRQIRPRTVVYLFSAGKDSSLSLLLTRGFVRDLCAEIKCKAFVVYIYVTGNTHPLNNACAHYVMQWHKKYYGFEPIYLASPKNFLECVAKYGFEMPRGRWCWAEFKEKPLRELQARLPKPLLYVDGMSPSDSVARERTVTDEVQFINTTRGSYWAWHPLFSLSMSSKERLELLKQHEEFKCVAQLYELYGDSMNCVICPYKSREKLMKLAPAEPAEIYYAALEVSLHSPRWKKRLALLKGNRSLEEYVLGSLAG